MIGNWWWRLLAVGCWLAGSYPSCCRNDDDIWAGRHSRVASCFFRVFFSLLLSRFVVISHAFSPPPRLQLFSLLHLPVPSRPTRFLLIVLADARRALHAPHALHTPTASLSPQSPSLDCLPQTRRPTIASPPCPRHSHSSRPRSTPLVDPASSRFHALRGASSPVSAPSALAPSYAVGGIAKLSLDG
jgi:hypothetical protein